MSKDQSQQPAGANPLGRGANPTSGYPLSPNGNSIINGQETGAVGAQPIAGSLDGLHGNSTGSVAPNPNYPGAGSGSPAPASNSNAPAQGFYGATPQLFGPTAALFGVPNGGYYQGPDSSGARPGTGTGSSANQPAGGDPTNPGAAPGTNPLARPTSGTPPPGTALGTNPLARGNPNSATTPQLGAPLSTPPSSGTPGTSPIAGGTPPPPPIPYGNVQNSLDTSHVPGLVGGDALQQQMQQAQQAAYRQATAYLDPQWANAQHDLETKLANQGIPVGSEAYQRATDEFQRNKAFAYSQAQQAAVQQGNAAQAQLFGQGLSANQNAFGQALSGGQFSNSAESQIAAQILANLGFNEQVSQHNFADSMSTRQQDINELLLQQQNPLQMYQALTQGSSVTPPNFSATPGTSVAGTDIASIIAQALGQQNNVYNTQVGAQNSNTSAYAAILAALLSDRRFKRNVRMIGMHEVGVPLYSFDYVWGEPGIGVMADEIAKVRPSAVIPLSNGMLAVNYAEFSKVA